MLVAQACEEYRLDPKSTMLLIHALAHNLGSTPTQSALRSSMQQLASAHTHVPTTKTIVRYLEALADFGLILEVDGWVPPTRDLRRMQIKPRHHLVDPSLALAALGISEDELAKNLPLSRAIISNVCVRDLSIYTDTLAGEKPGCTPFSSSDSSTDAAGATSDGANRRIRYYHDDSNLQVDAIVERPDGSWGAFMFRQSESSVQEASSCLLRLRRKLCEGSGSRARASAKAAPKSDCLATNGRPTTDGQDGQGQITIPDPSFLAVITGSGQGSWRTPEGICVIPVTMLAP